MPGILGDEALGREHEGRHAGLHVGCAAPVQATVAHDRVKRVAGPGRARTGRHHVGMAEQAQQWPAFAVHGPEVADGTEVEVFDPESGSHQARGDQALAAGILRRDRIPRDQLARKRQDVGVPTHLPKRSL